jgi:hypothetical protein
MVRAVGEDDLTYLIPADNLDRFNHLLTAIQSEAYGSESWHAAHDVFDEEFSSFLVG